MKSISLSALLVVVSVLPLPAAAEETLRDGARNAGHAVGSAVHDVGQGAKKVGKDVVQGAKQAGKEVGGAAREGGRELKKAVKGEK